MFPLTVHFLLVLAVACSGRHLVSRPVSAVPFKLDVLPDSEGQDKKHYLTITCKLDASLTSMEKVTALTLYGPRPYGAVDRMDPLASVDLWTPQPQLSDGLDESHVEVLGKLGSGNDSQSWLIFSWKSPMNSVPKHYKCVANGLATDGQAVSISTTSDGDTDSKIGMRNLQIITQQITNEVINLTSQVKATDQILTSKVRALQESVDAVREITNAQNSSLQQLQDGVFYWTEQWKLVSLMNNFDFSKPLSGKTYFVSKTAAPFDIQAANALCAAASGGHLAEIETKDQNDFVVNFVKSKNVDSANIYFLGGNDIEEEGVWRHYHSKKPISFLNWGEHEPNNSAGAEHCLELRVSNNKYNDKRCNSVAKFICESPA
ncbi:C-type lectin [Plakobranchus ocellatus]|uniref:C-type lectin n=1 Tax=Plakobranchus ocellatus TaxID=259542 RepID=A0AAV3YVE3_9GAST|nr:C-type lectin [Plakobranchus ocellatus]